jgi:hypothetical protein
MNILGPSGELCNHKDSRIIDMTVAIGGSTRSRL